MNVSAYIDEETFIHKLDPRTKILAVGFIIGLLLCFNHPAFVGLILLLPLLISIFAKAVVRIWQIRVPIIVVIMISTLTWPLFESGSTLLLSWWILHISKESLLFGIAMGLRLAGMIITILVFLSIIRPEDFFSALLRMKVPYPLVFVLSLAMRLMPMYISASIAIVEAQTSRGFDLSSGSLPSRVRKYMSLPVPLFIYACRQVDLLTIALEARGFDPGGMERTSYRVYSMRGRDYIIVIILGLLLLSAILCRFRGMGVSIPGRM